jgi:hypothetical protein
MPPTQKPQELPRLLSTTEAARALRISPATLAVWRVRGRGCGLRFLKVGRSVRYTPEDIRKFLDRRSHA